MANSTGDFYIGLLLAISSSVFIGSSFIVKKKGLLKLNFRAGNGGFGYLKEWMWWAGLLLMGIGEAANFIAYAFAPATLVTPLGALSVLVSAFLAAKWLKEHLNILGKTGCVVCLLGSTFIVLHSPKEQEIDTLRNLEPHLTDPGFIAYTIFVLLVSLFFIFVLGPRYGTTNPFIYIVITGTIGSLSVMGCKALGVGLKEVFAGNTEIFRYWLFWFIIIFLILFISVQMIYLNKALDLFNTAVVTPLLYVIFTTCVIIASGILYKEWSNLTFNDVVGNICGFITIICGVFLLQGFKNFDITLASVLAETKLFKPKDYLSDDNYGGNSRIRTYNGSDFDSDHATTPLKGHRLSNSYDASKIITIETEEEELYGQKNNYYTADNSKKSFPTYDQTNSYRMSDGYKPTKKFSSDDMYFKTKLKNSKN